MANKKPDSRNTNPVDRKIRDEGAPVPRIQPIIKPDRERGATHTKYSTHHTTTCW